jgi:acyl dehydratase
MNKKELQFSDVRIGENTKFCVLITEKMVNDFSQLSGDDNPLHMDDQYASSTTFGKRIAHGMIAGCLFSRLVGVYLPGVYALYLTQTINFKKPIFLETEVEVVGEVLMCVDAFHIVEIKTSIYDKKTRDCLVDGVAMVKLLK